MYTAIVISSAVTPCARRAAVVACERRVALGREEVAARRSVPCSVSQRSPQATVDALVLGLRERQRERDPRRPVRRGGRRGFRGEPAVVSVASPDDDVTVPLPDAVVAAVVSAAGAVVAVSSDTDLSRRRRRSSRRARRPRSRRRQRSRRSVRTVSARGVLLRTVTTSCTCWLHLAYPLVAVLNQIERSPQLDVPR